MSDKNKKPTSDQIAVWKQKADKWDALEKQISKFYVDENDEELDDEDGGNLLDIGEVAAIAFGFM